MGHHLQFLQRLRSQFLLQLLLRFLGQFSDSLYQWHQQAWHQRAPLALVAVIPEVDRVVVDSSGALPSMPGSNSGSPRGSKIPAGFRAVFSILQGEVLFLVGLCSLYNANCPVPAMTHRVYVAVKLSPRELCSSDAIKQGVTLAALADLAHS